VLIGQHGRQEHIGRERGPINKEGAPTLAGRPIARTLHHALPTSRSADGCDSRTESKTMRSIPESLMRLMNTSAEVHTALDLLLCLSSPSTVMAQA